MPCSETGTISPPKKLGGGACEEADAQSHARSRIGGIVCDMMGQWPEGRSMTSRMHGAESGAAAVASSAESACPVAGCGTVGGPGREPWTIV